MTVKYLFCPYCGLESFEEITVETGDHDGINQFVVCPVCGDQTCDFDDVDSIVEESTDEE